MQLCIQGKPKTDYFKSPYLAQTIYIFIHQIMVAYIYDIETCL